MKRSLLGYFRNARKSGISSAKIYGGFEHDSISSANKRSARKLDRTRKMVFGNQF